MYETILVPTDGSEGAIPLIILTDVEFASVNYDRPDQQPLCRPSPEEWRAHLDAGEFGEGSMASKIEACLRVMEQAEEQAVITSPEHLKDALVGETGTQVRA